MISVVGESAGGREEPPDWTELKNFLDDIARPLLLAVGTVVVSFGPAVAFTAWRNWRAFGDPWFWALLVGGMVYFPMGLLAVALHDSLDALKPWLIVPAIIRTAPSYILLVLIFYVLFSPSMLLATYMTEAIPILGPLLACGMLLYLLMVDMRILGLFCRCAARRLGWFQ
jgi:hypothetical protein